MIKNSNGYINRGYQSRILRGYTKSYIFTELFALKRATFKEHLVIFLYKIYSFIIKIEEDFQEDFLKTQDISITTEPIFLKFCGLILYIKIY